jgi:imidazolonepropionase-like amidohydrolase
MLNPLMLLFPVVVNAWAAPPAPVAPARVAAPAGPTAFVGVTVVPADRERLIPDQTVVVEGGRITQLGPAARVKIPEGAVRVEGRGKFLMPGIAEMHGHLPGAGAPEAVIRQWMTLYVANGVTTVRGVKGDANQPALRDRIARGEMMGPRLFVYGPPFQDPKLGPEEAARLVGEYKQAGFDGLKVGEWISLATYQAIMREAKKQGLPVAGHVPNTVGLARALAAGQSSIEHFDGYVEALAGDDHAAKTGGADAGATAGPPRTRVSVASWVDLTKVDEGRIPALVSATRQARAVVVPTMVVWRNLVGDFDLEQLKRLPELPYFHQREVAEWTQDRTRASRERPPLAQLRRLMAVRDHLLKALGDGGVVVLGSDSPQVFSVPGFSMRHEAAAMVKAGLSPWQVVQAGTSAVARYLKVEREQGTVAVGKRADLVLVDGNPLADVANIFRSSGVMLNGRWLPRAELDRQLAQIAQDLKYPADAEVKDLPVSASEATALLGRYQFEDNTLTVARTKDDAKGEGKEVLTMTATDKSGSRTLRLRSQGGGVYLMPEVKARVTFEVQQGRATTMIGNQGGATFKAARLPE